MSPKFRIFHQHSTKHLQLNRSIIFTDQEELSIVGVDTEVSKMIEATSLTGR